MHMDNFSKTKKNKNPQMWRGLGHITLTYRRTLWNIGLYRIYETSNATNFQFGA